MTTDLKDLHAPRRPGAGAALRRAVHRKSTWIVGVPVVLVIATAGGMFGYVQYLNSKTPPPLSFGDVPAVAAQGSGSPTATYGRAAPAARATASVATTPGSSAAPAAASVPSRAATAAPVIGRPQAAAAPASGVDGRWLVGHGSLAGYRIGYSTPVGGGTRVGRGEAVTGEFTMAGTTLRSASFSVDMRQVKCDGGDACTQHVNEIMDTANRPFELFKLSTPVDLKSIPADGKQITVSVSGHLTLRGVTRSVRFPLSARRHAGRIEVLGAIPVNRDDYQIPDSGEPGFTIDKKGTIEVLLVFDHHA